MRGIVLSLLKKHLKKIIYGIIFGIIGFVGCLFVVQFPYWIGESRVLIRTHFGAADVLGFLGDYITAFGTLTLGLIAIKQTEKANSISDKVAELEAAKHKEEHDPVILIDWVKLHDFSYNQIACKVGFDGQLHYIDAKFENDINEERQCIEINFINTGRSGIYNCKLEEVSSQPDELKGRSAFTGVSDAPFSLETGKNLKLNLFVYPNAVERFAIREIEKIRLVFSCVNDFNEKYNLIFDIEGAIKLLGNNRCDAQLVPSTHPVKWIFKTEKGYTCD